MAVDANMISDGIETGTMIDSLDQYMEDLQNLGVIEKLVSETMEPTQDIIEQPVETPVETVEEILPPVTTEIDLDSLMRNPDSGRKIQSMIDRRVAGMEKTIEQRVAERFEQQSAVEARTAAQKAAEREYNEALELAMSQDDFDEQVIEARRKVATILNSQRQRATLEQELTPQLFEQVQSQVTDHLGQQYDQGLQRIPEFSTHQDKLNWRNYQTADEWVVNAIETVAESRVLAERQRLTEHYENQIAKLADDKAGIKTTQAMAEYRSTLPNPDLGETPGGGNINGPRPLSAYRSQLEIQQDIDFLLNRYSSATIRGAMSGLPYR